MIEFKNNSDYEYYLSNFNLFVLYYLTYLFLAILNLLDIFFIKI